MKKYIYIISKFIDKKEVSREEITITDYKLRKLKKELDFLDYSNNFKGCYLKLNYYNENEKAFNRIIELNKIIKYFYKNIDYFMKKYTTFEIKIYIKRLNKELKTLLTSKIVRTNYIIDIFITLENIKFDLRNNSRDGKNETF
uniref:Uncharacterized protein n=1 Tax=Siphoviridae sp. ctnR613 TaxID=2827939 RepID=A0A8S5SPY4_9CAUD|nr:MAG TPA: hypothetical protein [Siphoviridae sp. ctnR613]